MKVSVIGCGYLGAVHAACMAELGHEVVGIDVDEKKIELLAQGKSPFHEPDLPALLDKHTHSGRLRFSTDFADISDARVHFIGVGTPQLDDSGSADLSYVRSAVDSILPHVQSGRTIIVGKSTVPVGTAQSLEQQIVDAGGILIWNPEFLRESFAVEDTLRPDRLVYGLSDDETRARISVQVLDEVYSPIISAGTPRLVMNYATSELVKVSANSFLAVKISYINAMAEVCEATGADVKRLAEAIGMDDRIGRKFLRAGIGFGGGCLPKDIRAFKARTEELGLPSLNFLADIDAINERRRYRVVEMCEEELGDLTGKRLAILGAAFKPNSDDMRNSPALAISDELAARGAHIVITDPEAGPILAATTDRFEVAASAEEAMTGAEATLLLTEWKQFSSLDPSEVAALPAHRLIIDGRNVLDPKQWRAAGWTYRGMGRP
ncbi:MAG: UDP-glucose/GDP-mannose dehydrogenase family protein [Flaviflexus sp.]|nr:UDP-glucose/GDP-mannose dehydrogenase family protein [Flaviflexus sp.]